MPTSTINTHHEKVRCGWCGDDPLYQRYHDEEWGEPLNDDRALFELLCLEGAQAGLSWITVLRKRERYREVFCHFELEKVARLSDAQLEKILLDPGIIRNRLKVFGVRKNALALKKLLKEEQTSFSDWLWRFTGGQPLVKRPATLKDIRATSAESDALSKALKNRGFTFVGSTICYAFLQASGRVNDHVLTCWKGG